MWKVAHNNRTVSKSADTSEIVETSTISINVEKSKKARDNDEDEPSCTVIEKTA